MELDRALASIRNRQVVVARSSPILVRAICGKSGFNPKSEAKVKLKLMDVARDGRQCDDFRGGVLAGYAAGAMVVGGVQVDRVF